MTFPSLYLTVLVISSLRGPNNIFAYRVVVITGVDELNGKLNAFNGAEIKQLFTACNPRKETHVLAQNKCKTVLTLFTTRQTRTCHSNYSIKLESNVISILRGGLNEIFALLGR